MLKRCLRCVLPETYPEITFDNEGVCNYCRNYLPVKYKGEDALKTLLESFRDKGEWDCLVPLSGGRDSTYTIFQLVKKYALRILAYNYDNGFVEDIAKQNIQSIADQLGIDVVYVNSLENLQCKNVSYLTKMNIRKTPGHVLTFLCSGCRNGIWGGAFKVARERRIPLVIFGESSMESGGFKKKFAEIFKPTLQEKIKFMLQMPLNFYHRKNFYNKLQREFPLPSKNDSGVTQLNFFDYEEWNEKRIMSLIQDELNWQHKEGQSSWRFDCQIHAMVNRMVYQLLGMTEKDELYSKLIREGQITREEALEIVIANEEEEKAELEIVEKVMERLQLIDSEKQKIRRFCQGPPKLRNCWV